MFDGLSVLSIAIAYLIGAMPFGLFVVKKLTGKDIRSVGSGRSGATNVMRAAGLVPAIATALFDILKGAAPIWLAKQWAPDVTWVHVLAGVAAVLGHNYSIFLRETTLDPNTGRKTIKLRGGAGGATTVGGAIGLWPWNAVIIIPLGAAILFGIGYASVATMSVGIMTMIIMALRAHLGHSGWEYVIYGLCCFILQLWALRPNIRRLIAGTERLVGWRAKRITGNLTADPSGLKHE